MVPGRVRGIWLHDPTFLASRSPPRRTIPKGGFGVHLRTSMVNLTHAKVDNVGE